MLAETITAFGETQLTLLTLDHCFSVFIEGAW